MQRGRILVPEQVGLLCLLTENRVIKKSQQGFPGLRRVKLPFLPQIPKMWSCFKPKWL